MTPNYVNRLAVSIAFCLFVNFSRNEGVFAYLKLQMNQICSKKKVDISLTKGKSCKAGVNGEGKL